LTVGGRIQDAGQDRGLTKAGAGSLVLAGNSLYTGPTNVNAGTTTLTGSLGNTTVAVGANSTFIDNGTVNNNVSVSGVIGGTGTVNGSLTVNNTGIVDLTGGTFTVNGAIVNNGLFILSNGSQLAGVTSFTNNGTLDIMTDGTFNPPPNFTNNGTIIDSSVVKTKAITRSGTTVHVTIDSYTDHTYQLLKSNSPGFNSLNNVGPSQQGNTGTTLTFSDPNATGTSAFYRILVNP
jgi:autotransporter-associated beta strand protein